MKKIALLLSAFFVYQLNAITIDKEFFTIEFSPEHKGATKVVYDLDKKVSEKNLKKRNNFYVETSLPKKLRVDESLFTNTGTERGHIANDASFDWSEESKNATYSMANIVPQYPNVNKIAWFSVEEMERYTALQFGNIKVTNLIDYSNYTILKKLPLNDIIERQEKKNGFKNAKHKEQYINKKMREEKALEKAQIHIPSGFYKILENKEHNFKECYYVPNIPDIKSDKASDYKINCSKISL